MSGFNSNKSKSSKPDQLTIEMLTNDVKIKLNNEYQKVIEDTNVHYITKFVKVLYFFCKEMHTNLLNIRNSYLFCSRNWIIENVVVFFSQLQMPEIIAIINDNDNYNKMYPNKKDLYFKKIVLTQVLEEDYDEEIENYNKKMKKSNISLDQKFNTLNKKLKSKFNNDKNKAQFINPNQNKFTGQVFNQLIHVIEDKKKKYLQDLNAQYYGNMEKVDGGRSRKRKQLKKRKSKTKKHHGK
jgi:hypothetical protein